MSHVRQQIREAAATALTGQTLAVNDVFSSFVYPSEGNDLPLIHVRIDSEESEQAAMGGLLTRLVTLLITAVADGDERDLDNTLDTLAAEIESIIGGNTFSSAAKQTVLIGTEVERSADGKRPTAAITLSFAVVYHTDEQDGEIAL